MASRSLVLLVGLLMILLLISANHPANRETTVPPSAPLIEATVQGTIQPLPATEVIEATAEETAESTLIEAATAESTESPTVESTGSSAGLVGDPARGQFIFEHGMNGAPACTNCHSRASKTPPYALAPSLSGIALRAATRVAGMTAPQYIEDSIRHPADYVVSGFHAIMYSKFAQDYSDQDIADLIAYVMTL